MYSFMCWTNLFVHSVFFLISQNHFEITGCFKSPVSRYKKSSGHKLRLQGGSKLVEIKRSLKILPRKLMVFVDTWGWALSCCNHLLRSYFFSWDANCWVISWYTSSVIVYVKKIGPAIPFLNISHHTPIFLDADLTLDIRADFHLFCQKFFPHFLYNFVA